MDSNVFELTKKMFSGLPIDVNKITDNLTMFLYLISKDLEYRRIRISHDEIASDAVEAYEIFKKKNTLENKYKQSIESYHATFQLVLIFTKLAENEKSIDEPVLNEIKTLIQEAYKSKLVSYLLHLVVPLASGVVFRGYSKICRSLEMITIDCIKRTVYLNPAEDQKMYFLNAKLIFLSELLDYVNFVAKIPEEVVEKFDGCFEGFLEELEVENLYPELTESHGVVNNKMVARIMLSTVDEFKFCCVNYKGRFPIKLANESIRFWRGLAFQELSYSEKSSHKRVELVMASMEEWLVLLATWSHKLDLVELGKSENYGAMMIFLSTSDRNLYNYENIIETKSDEMKHLNQADSKVAIREINQLRHDLIMMLKHFLSFEEVRPDVFNVAQLRRLYLTIAEQYRCIILENKSKQEWNLRNSIIYIRKHIAVDLKNADTEDKIIQMIDSLKFIRKYRV